MSGDKELMGKSDLFGAYNRANTGISDRRCEDTRLQTALQAAVAALDEVARVVTIMEAEETIARSQREIDRHQALIDQLSR